MFRRLNFQKFPISYIQSYENLNNAFITEINAKRSISIGHVVKSKIFAKNSKFLSVDVNQRVNGVRTANQLNQTHRDNEVVDMMKMFPDMVRELAEEANKYHTLNNTKYATERFVKALEYNVSEGKKNRGITTIITFRELADKSQLTEENIRRVRYLAWCQEMLQASLVMKDDVEDSSVRRRGKLCWHLVEGVGLTALNDAAMIKNAIYVILKKQFGDTDYYIKLVDLFQSVSFHTLAGLMLENAVSKRDITEFNMNIYYTINIKKSIIYSFYLPIASGMHMCGISDPELFRQAENISFKMGPFFQVQNDYFDCYGQTSITTDEVGTDIEEGKCTWLAVKCLERANEAEKQIMKECYGKKDPEKVLQVRQLYKHLKIPEAYKDYEKGFVPKIKEQIKRSTEGGMQKIFLNIFDDFYKSRVNEVFQSDTRN